MIREALCWSYLKHTNGSPHHSLLPCSPFMELIPPVPRDRATSAKEQGSKCLPPAFVFSQYLGPVSARSRNKKNRKSEKKGRETKGWEKSMTTLGQNQCYLAQTWAWVAGGNPDMSQSSTVFSLSLVCAFSPPLPLPHWQGQSQFVEKPGSRMV